MPIEIIVPRLGWSMEQGAFVAWLKQEGELVRAGEPLFSIEGDKAIQEIESIDSGMLRIAANCPPPGGTVRVGDVLGHLVMGNEAAPRPAAARLVETVAKPVQIAPTAAPSLQASVPTISPRAWRVAAELGLDWTKIQGSGRTGRIREQDIRAAAGSEQSSVLVTGGCGFIGTWVIRELWQRGLRVVVLDAGERPARWERVIGAGSASVPLVQGSLLDRELLARIFTEHRVARVIHLAALLTPACQADPWEGCRVNVLGTMALFEQVRSSSIRGFSYASSVGVFGDETGAHDPVTFYGVFKKSCELIAAQYWRHFQIASVGIRPQVAYGPEREAGLTAGPSLAAKAAARGEPYSINYTGRVGYDYAEDVAHAFIRGALETPPGAQIVDLAGEMADMEQVLAAIRAAAPETAARLTANGPPIPVLAPPKPRFISTLYPDWKTTPLAEGFRRTVEFYRAPASPGNPPIRHHAFGLDHGVAVRP